MSQATMSGVINGVDVERLGQTVQAVQQNPSLGTSEFRAVIDGSAADTIDQRSRGSLAQVKRIQAGRSRSSSMPTSRTYCSGRIKEQIRWRVRPPCVSRLPDDFAGLPCCSARHFY